MMFIEYIYGNISQQSPTPAPMPSFDLFSLFYSDDYPSSHDSNCRSTQRTASFPFWTKLWSTGTGGTILWYSALYARDKQDLKLNQSHLIYRTGLANIFAELRANKKQ